MTFLNTALLWGLGLVSIPVIIHIIRKNKVIELDWAAMEFLFDIVEEQKKRFQLEDLLLLLLRIGVILFLVLALARPVINSTMFGLGGGNTIVAVDDTYSMETRSGTKTRFDRAAEAAGSVISGMNSNKGGALVLHRANPEKVIGSLSGDLGLMTEAVNNLKVSDFHGNDSAGLKTALDIINKEKPAGTSLFFISDFQKSEWENPSPELAEVVKALKEKTDIVFVNAGDTELNNLSVKELRCLQSSVKINETAWFTAKVYNSGTEDNNDVPVYFSVDETVRETVSISVPAGQSTSVVFKSSVDVEGYHSASVRIGIDANKKDNMAFTHFKAYEKLKVLALQNFRPTNFDEKRALFVDFAMNPYPGASSSEQALYKFTWSNVSALSSEDLNQYSFIIMDDVRAMTSTEVKFLEDYVRDGGGLYIAMGKNSDVDNYNRVLHKDGKGIFAWPLMDTAVEEEEDGKFLNVQVENAKHDIWGFINSEEGLSGFRLKKAFGFLTTASDRAFSLMKLRSEGDDRSLMACFNYGRGKAYVMGTTSTMEWNNMATLPLFLPFVRKVTSWLMKERFGEPNLYVGSSYYEELSEDKARAEFELTSPSGNTSSADVTINDKKYFLNIPSFKEAGIYKLQERGGSYSRIFSVNLEGRESEIESLSTDELKTKYSPMGIKVVDIEGVSTITSGNNTSDISKFLLILVALCWLGENLLTVLIAKRGQHG